MLDYEIRLSQDASGGDHFGAFGHGTHDDLVCAVGLACLREPAGEVKTFERLNTELRNSRLESLRGVFGEGEAVRTPWPSSW